jgi:hypothetical protein
VLPLPTSELFFSTLWSCLQQQQWITAICHLVRRETCVNLATAIALGWQAGANKGYSPTRWQTVDPAVLQDKLWRHLGRSQSETPIDAESGVPHKCLFLFNLFVLAWQTLERTKTARLSFSERMTAILADLMPNHTAEEIWSCLMDEMHTPTTAMINNAEAPSQALQVWKDMLAAADKPSNGVL